MSKLPNIFIVGPMGAGKTTIGRLIAKELQRDFYDTDQYIEDSTGASVSWIFDIEGEAGFREREKQAIEKLTGYSNIILATGGGAILAPENRQNLAARGIVVYLKVSLEDQLERTHKGKTRPLLETENVLKTLENLKAAREPLYQEIADIEFDTSSRSVRSIANKIIKYFYTRLD